MGSLHLRSCIFVTLAAIAFKVCNSTSTTCTPDRRGCGPAGSDDDPDDQLTLLQSRPASRKAKPVEDASPVESTYVGERATPSANTDPDAGLTKAVAVEIEAGMAADEHSGDAPPTPPPVAQADAPQPSRDEPQSKAEPPPPPPGAPAAKNDALVAKADAAKNDAPAAKADAEPAAPATDAPAAKNDAPAAKADAGPAAPATGAPAANDAPPAAKADTRETAAKDAPAKTEDHDPSMGSDFIDQVKTASNDPSMGSDFIDKAKAAYKDAAKDKSKTNSKGGWLGLVLILMGWFKLW